MNYSINRPTITYETIDGEAVIINLENGSYYSLAGSGAEIIELIDGGADIGTIIDTMTALYVGDPAEIQDAMAGLVEELLREGIILPSDQGETLASVQDRPLPDIGGGAGRPAFVLTALQKFTDMEELLMLDVIHDVDESGWPHAKRDHL